MRLDVRWVALALWLPLAAARAGTSTEYAYAFPLDTKESAEAYRVVLNPAVYASVNASAALRDLVVVNALGQPVPFGPLPPTPPVKHHYMLETRLLPVPTNAATHDGVQVARNADGGIVISQQAADTSSQRPQQWLVDAGREVELSGIALESASLQQDFQVHLAVEASNDLR